MFYSDIPTTTLADVAKEEEVKKKAQFMILFIFNPLNVKTIKDGEEISMYLDMCRDVERIGDHAIGIVRDVRYEIKKKLVFTETAHKEVQKLFLISKEIIETAEAALKNDDTEKAFTVVDLHNKLYAKEKEVKHDIKNSNKIK